MLLVYTPEGGERQEFVFRPIELNNLDAEDLEEVGGNVWDDSGEFERAFHQGKTRALRAALWISLRATKPELTFDQVQFRLNEVDVFLEPEEREQIRQALQEGLYSGAQAEQAKAILAAVPEPEGKDEVAAGDTSST
jgi:hypothetical protein